MSAVLLCTLSETGCRQVWGNLHCRKIVVESKREVSVAILDKLQLMCGQQSLLWESRMLSRLLLVLGRGRAAMKGLKSGLGMVVEWVSKVHFLKKWCGTEAMMQPGVAERTRRAGRWREGDRDRRGRG